MSQLEPDRENYDLFTPPTGPSPEDEENSPGAKPVEATEADGKRQLIGYAVVWGAISDVRRDGFRHTFQKGSITWANPSNALWNHDLGVPLGSTDNSTLTITEDDYGARVEIDLDDTTDADNAFKRVKSRLVRGMSFGGKRIAYDRTADPKVINVTSFLADEVTITIAPGMTETNIVTSDNATELQKQAAIRGQKQQLAKMKLAMFAHR